VNRKATHTTKNINVRNLLTDEVTTNSDIAVTARKQRRPKAIVRRDSPEAYFIPVNSVGNKLQE